MLVLLLGGGNVKTWAESYEIVFKTATSDQTNDVGSNPSVSKMIETGNEYVASFSSCSKAYLGTKGIKLGTGSATGTINFTLASSCQSNIKSIKVVSAKYGSDTGTLTLWNGNSSLHSGITPGTDYTHTFDAPTTVSSIKIATSTKRAYITKIILTTEESTLKQSNLELTGTPKVLSFDLYNNATAQVIDYTTSSTGTVTVESSNYINAVVDAEKKTITVTPIAVTPSQQTIKVSQAADETYDAGIATFKVSVDDSTPSPSYTVTLGDDSSTLTEVTSGAGVILPSRSTIAGYDFAGWSETCVSDETTTAPTILPAGAYSPTANITLYPIYTKQEGGTNTDSGNVFASGSYNSSKSLITWTIADLVSITQEQNTGETAPNGTYVANPRWYTGNKITITPIAYINSLSITATTTNYATALISSTYTNAIKSANGTEVTITPTDGSKPITIVMAGQSRLSSLIINYIAKTTYYWSSPVAVAVETPVITVPETFEGSNSTTATITCATEGTTIYYSFDNENWSEYTNTLTISTTTTIYAKAVKGEDESAVASKTTTMNVEMPTFSVTEGTYTEAQSVELSCATDGATIYYTTDGTTPSAESTAYTAAINVSESQTIKAIAIKNGVSSTIATAEYTIIPSVVTTTTGYFAKITSTDDLKNGKYLIVSAASNVAFNGSLAALDATSNTISVDINNDKISASEETLSAAFTIDVTNGTIKNASNKYIGVNTNENGLKLTDNASTYTNSFAIDENGNATISAVFAESTMKLQYNRTSGQERFRYFKSTQQAIQLYRYVDVKLNSNGYATFASSTALDFSNASDYTAWQITDISNDNGNYTISFNKITGTIAAGTGILLKGNSNAYITLTAAESGTDISGTNKLVGITEATAISAGEYYGLSGKTFVKVKAGTVPAGKALLPASLVTESTGGNVKAFTFVFNDLTTGVNAVDNGQWTMDNGAIFDLSGRRLSKPAKGINIINGKKVVVK